MPDPARGERDGVRERVAADDGHDRVERDGNAVGRQEDGDHDQLRDPRAERRQQNLEGVVALVREDGAALLRLLPEARDLAPELLRDEDDQDHAARDEQRNEKPMVVDEAELEVERPRNRDEEVEVDERPDDGVEDLLDERCADDARERRAANQGDVHQEGGERADVRRQEAVHRDPGSVGGEDVAVAHTAVRVARGEDVVPRKRRQRGLDRLEEDTGHDVLDRDLLHRVPDRREPPEDVEAGEVADHERGRDPEQPQGDLEQPARTRAVVEGCHHPNGVVKSTHGREASVSGGRPRSRRAALTARGSVDRVPE